jgi:hypothetical protein
VRERLRRTRGQQHSAASPQVKENQKAKGKNQKAKISAPGRGPGWEGIFRGWPRSKQSPQA